MSKAKFPVQSNFDHANKLQPGVVTIDRETGLFSVRVRGRHTEHSIPLSKVAELIHQMCEARAVAETRPKRRFMKKSVMLPRG